MSQRLHAKLLALILALALSGCASSAGPSPSVAAATTTPTHAPISTPTASSPMPDIADCDPDEIVTSLQSVVPYAEFSLSQNVIDDVRNLNLWFVDPALDPLGDGDGLAGNLALARFHLASVSHRLKQASECVSLLFTGLTGIVVDRDYNVWFSGQVSPANLPQSSNPSEGDLEAAGDRFVVGYARTQAVSSSGRPAAETGACLWPEVRERLYNHFEPVRQNLAFYLTIDDDGVNVWAQWDGPQDADAFFADLLALRTELTCLYPPVDTFWGIYLDGTGRAQVVVAVPGDAVRQADDEGLLTELEVVYPYVPE